MLILNNENMEFPLPDFIYDGTHKIRIYGTGEVAGSYYRKLMNMDENCVDCFIDSMKSKEVYFNKKVLLPSELTNVNKYIYVLASYTSSTSMKAELLKHGVIEENIIYDKRYTIDSFINIEHNIKHIILYPPIDTLDKLQELEQSLLYYLPSIKVSNVRLDILCNNRILGLLEQSADEHIVYTERIEYLDKEDLILVWDKNYLFKEDIVRHKYTYCIDPRFFQFIDTKILLSLNDKIITEEIKMKYEQNSKIIYKSFYEEYNNVEKAYVFGNGPSISEGIDKIPSLNTDKALKIVCNGCINNIKVMNAINPNTFIISDINHFKSEYESQVIAIMNYVMNNPCILVIPSYAYTYVVNKYPQIINKLVGLAENAKSINFPLPNKLSVYAKAHNVITRYSIPIASALAKKVYVLGCDGIDLGQSQKLRFDHYQGTEIVSTEKNYDDIELSLVYFMNHYTFFRELIEYGEEVGVEYITITQSHIPVLNERLEKNDSKS